MIFVIRQIQGQCFLHSSSHWNRGSYNKLINEHILGAELPRKITLNRRWKTSISQYRKKDDR